MGITTTNRTRGRRPGWVALAWLAASAATGRAAPGDIDMSFGSAGEYAPANSRSQLVALPSGPLLETVVARDGAGIALQTRRLFLDGRPDPAWGVAGQATVDLSRLPFRNEAWTSASWLSRPQQDGSVLVQLWLGTDARTSIGGLRAMPLDLVLRLRADGSLDARYGNQGMTLLQDGNINWIFDTIPQPDGSALIVEGCNVCDIYPYAVRIRRLLPDGTEDAGFNYRGAELDSVVGQVFTAVRRPDGMVLVVGSGGMLRLDADGRVDTSRGSNGRIDLDEPLTARLREATQRTDVSARIAAATLDRQGRILLALAAVGTSTAGPAIVDAIAVARLDADGGVDAGFGNGSGLGRLSLARAPWATEPFSGHYMTLGVAEDGGVTVHVTLYTYDATSPRGSPIGLARFDASGRPRIPSPDAGLQLLGYRAAHSLRAVGPEDWPRRAGPSACAATPGVPQAWCPSGRCRRARMPDCCGCLWYARRAAAAPSRWSTPQATWTSRPARRRRPASTTSRAPAGSNGRTARAA
jgi:Domain of unknown function (DUF5122) beta-propeller